MFGTVEGRFCQNKISPAGLQFLTQVRALSNGSVRRQEAALALGDYLMQLSIILQLQCGMGKQLAIQAEGPFGAGAVAHFNAVVGISITVVQYTTWPACR